MQGSNAAIEERAYSLYYARMREVFRRLGLPAVLQMLQRRPVLQRAVGISALLLGGVLLVAVFSAIVPYSLDEFTQFHALACFQYPLNALLSFRDNCQVYQLNLFKSGLILPLRSNPYVGSFVGLLYYPLFLLWRYPMSARFLGFLFLAGESAIFARILKVRFWTILLLFLCFFPCTFQHLVDTGPVAFHLFSVFLSFWLIERWLDRLEWFPPMALAVISFLAFWTKLNYVWLLPGIAIFALWKIWERREFLSLEGRWKRALLQAWNALLLLFIFGNLLFQSTQPENPHSYPYWDQIRDSAVNSLPEMLRSPTLRAMLNPFEATQRVYQASPMGLHLYIYDILLYFSVPFFLVCSAKKLWRHHLWQRSLLLYIVFLFTCVVILRTRAAWAMHHVVLAYPFLLLSVAWLLQALWSKRFLTMQKAVLCIATVFLSLNVAMFFLFPFQRLNPYDDHSKAEVNAILRNPAIAEKYVYVVASWGMYFLQSLYGDNAQAVYYAEGYLNPQTLTQIRSMAASLHRHVLFIYHMRVPGSFDAISGPNYPADQPEAPLQLLRSSFSLVPCAIQSGRGAWRIELENTMDPENPCLQSGTAP